MAQLYKEHAQMKEHAVTSIQTLSATTLRPFFVTDGNKKISRAWGDCSCTQVEMKEKNLRKKPSLKEKETVTGVPPLPKIGSSGPPQKMKHKEGRGRHGTLGNSNKGVNGKHFHFQGSVDESLLLCHGISIGIISAVISNKKEVNKLKELLIHTENLVQDLQDEIGMKDSLTVKDLPDENFEPQNC